LRQPLLLLLLLLVLVLLVVRALRLPAQRP
jgi:hypothetical protein